MNYALRLMVAVLHHAHHLHHHHHGGPAGLRALAVAVGEEEDTLELVYEPHLIRLGFLLRTSRGRQLTDAARRHIGARVGTDAGGLFPA